MAHSTTMGIGAGVRTPQRRQSNRMRWLAGGVASFAALSLISPDFAEFLGFVVAVGYLFWQFGTLRSQVLGLRAGM